MPADEANSGPFVTLAVFCERLLREADDVVSLIRVVDKFTLALPEGDDERFGVVEATLIVGMKAGGYVGPAEIAADHVRPDGTRRAVGREHVEFAGPLDGVQITADVRVGVRETGLYWFEVRFNDRLLTRTPMLVEVMRVPSGTAEAVEVDSASPPAEPHETAEVGR